MADSLSHQPALEGRLRLGKYQLVRLLGRGATADIYLAHDPKLRIDVAIKVIHASLASDPAVIERFRQEARAIAQMNHTHILHIYSFDDEDGLNYLVMRYIAGGTLAARLRCLRNRNQLLGWPEIGSIMAGLCSAVGYAHRKGLVHRDIKPANVMFDDDGASPLAMLTDFGVATLTGSRSIMGTPLYMSPEQARSEQLDGRSDIYSMGVLLFELATGELPFDGDDVYAILVHHWQTPPPRPSHINQRVPPQVDEVILRALAKNPADRFPNAEEFARALEAALLQPKTTTTGTLVHADSNAALSGAAPAAGPSEIQGAISPQPGGPTAAPSLEAIMPETSAAITSQPASQTVVEEIGPHLQRHPQPQAHSSAEPGSQVWPRLPLVAPIVGALPSAQPASMPANRGNHAPDHPSMVLGEERSDDPLAEHTNRMPVAAIPPAPVPVVSSARHKDHPIAMLRGPDGWQASLLPAQHFTLGRATGLTDHSIDIDLSGIDPARTVSRTHAQILIRGNACYIRDLTSRNGVRINELVLPSKGRQRLFHGDTLALGDVRLTFLQPDLQTEGGEGKA